MKILLIFPLVTLLLQQVSAVTFVSPTDINSVIRLDYDTNGDSGADWNAVTTAGTVSNPFYEQGGTTNNYITSDVTLSYSGMTSSAVVNNAASTHSIYGDQLNFTVASGGTATFTFANLDDNWLYNLQVRLGEQGDANDAGDIWTINGQDLTVNDLTSNNQNANYNNLYNLDNSIGLIGTDGSGNISFTFTDGSNDGEGFVGGFFLQAREVVPVPEPSSAALLGLGGLSLIVRRRR